MFQLQFNLKSLFLIVLVAGLLLSGIARSLITSYEQRQLSKAILAMGGTVQLCSEAGLPPTEWQRLSGRTGLMAIFWDRPFTDSDLEMLAKQSHRSALLRIFLDGTQVTDAGLPDLLKFPRLQTVCVGRSNITDAGILCLKEAESLKELNVRGTAVTADGVRELKRSLPHLLVYRTNTLDPE